MKINTIHVLEVGGVAFVAFLVWKYLRPSAVKNAINNGVAFVAEKKEDLNWSFGSWLYENGLLNGFVDDGGTENIGSRVITNPEEAVGTGGKVDEFYW